MPHEPSAKPPERPLAEPPAKSEPTTKPTAKLKSCRVIDLGVIRYGEAFALQEQLVAARKMDACPDLLLLCEHPHVITLGRNGKLQHLRASAELLGQMGVEFHHTDRGGDITYHGPGQIVGYPILQLGEIRRDVGWYVRQLEQTMIEASREFGVAAFRVAGCTGVWVREESAAGSPEAPVATDAGKDPQEGTAKVALEGPVKDEQKGAAKGALKDGPARVAQKEAPAQGAAKAKLGAIGVHLSRWVTSHGFAYNVASDLRFFDLIVPCGIPDCRTASLERLLGRKIDLHEVQPRIVEAFGAALRLEMVPAEREEMAEWISTAQTLEPPAKEQMVSERK